jgi:hypothetical protein
MVFSQVVEESARSMLYLEGSVVGEWSLSRYAKMSKET